MDRDTLSLITTPKLSECLRNIPQETLSLDYDDLEKKTKPTEKDRMLKISLQREIKNACTEGRKVVISTVCRGVCQLAHFFNNIMPNPTKLAWLMTPLPEQELTLSAQNEMSDRRINEILNCRLVDDDGKIIDINHAKLVLQAIKLVKDRTDPVVNRQEIKQLTVKHDTTKTHNIEERIKQLETELGKSRKITS